MHRMLSLKHRVLSLSAKSSDFNDDFRRIGEHADKEDNIKE
jgi:hypothetical protein